MKKASSIHHITAQCNICFYCNSIMCEFGSKYCGNKLQEIISALI